MTTNATMSGHQSASGLAALQSDESTDHLLQMVSFTVDEETFAIDILPVREIVRVMNITRVPHCPPHVEGVVNLRGQITPVVDLRQRFGRRANGIPSDGRIIVVEMCSGVLGFAVDQVSEVMTIPRSIVDEAPPLVNRIDSQFIQGVAKLDGSLVIVLDLDRLFSNQDLEGTATMELPMTD